jgi:hypothetical protein
MRLFENKRFYRWARDEGLTEKALCQAAKEVIDGGVEADLGGYLFKKRIAGKGGGKSGGYRTIVGYRRGNTSRVVFLYGFAKNERPNITGREHEALSIAATALIDATDKQVADLILRGRLFELRCEQI